MGKRADKELEQKVKDWFVGLGFQDNTNAEIPNYILSISTYIDPNSAMRQVFKEYRYWDPIDDTSFISPEVAMYLYLMFGDTNE